MISTDAVGGISPLPLAHAELDDWRGQATVFEDIFLIFLILGTLVGIVVVSYMVWNAYKYREGATPAAEFEEPTLGELPTGGKGGKKLFLSFALSAIIVVSLVAWSYMALLYVEDGATAEIETEYNVEIEGIQFGWDVTYPNGESTFNNIYLPVDTNTELTVTSDDVWHTFGVTDLRIKADAIPGQEATTWVLPEEETGDDPHRAECFELCGAGHSAMDGSVYVIDQETWETAFYDDVDEDADISHEDLIEGDL